MTGTKLIDAADLAAVTGGASKTTWHVGAQVKGKRYGFVSESIKSDYDSCIDYVREHGHSVADCEPVRGLSDRYKLTMSDRSVHGAGTPTR
ncbi:MAG: hypothetical protein AB7P03_19930 [Kofleriaceae bacterium]